MFSIENCLKYSYLNLKQIPPHHDSSELLESIPKFKLMINKV